jgi:hypothetical protein
MSLASISTFQCVPDFLYFVGKPSVNCGKIKGAKSFLE